MEGKNKKLVVRWWFWSNWTFVNPITHCSVFGLSIRIRFQWFLGHYYLRKCVIAKLTKSSNGTLMLTRNKFIAKSLTRIKLQARVEWTELNKPIWPLVSQTFDSSALPKYCQHNQGTTCVLTLYVMYQQSFHGVILI